MPTSGRAQTGAAIGREFSYALSRRASWRHRVQVLDTYPGAPSESAPGPSGSFSSGWPATARMTLLTLDRTHLGRRKALPIWRGTDGSNPSPSSGESANFQSLTTKVFVLVLWIS